MAVADVKLAGLVAESVEAVASLSDSADSAGERDAVCRAYPRSLRELCGPSARSLSGRVGSPQ